MPPLISVLLPARNAAQTLRPAIRSVLRQTLANFELIILDDTSTDGSPDIARDFRDERVLVLPAEGAPGLVARLNQGIEAARGTFIARMDADDVCFPERFEKQAAALRANSSIDLIGSRVMCFIDGGDAFGLLPFRGSHREICARPWQGFYLPHPTWMGRAEWFRRHKYRVPEVVRAEDQELLLRAMPVSRYAALPDVLLGYRCRPLSMAPLWTARHNLVSAQLKIFASRGQFVYSCAALAICLGRILSDLTRQVGRRRNTWLRSEPLTGPGDAQFLRSLVDPTSE